MIKTTNDVRSFLEEENGPIYIYGVGNAGYWIGKYMWRTDNAYDGYIDKAATTEDCMNYGKRIYPLETLNDRPEDKMRIMISVPCVDEVLEDLCRYAHDKEIVCLVPLYEEYFSKQKCYDINTLLNYFRNKLMGENVPTIISNSCTAGFIYRFLGAQRKSPTINVVIHPTDFLKICKAPEVYLSQDIIFDHWTVFWGERIPVGRTGDVEVLFVHDRNAAEAINRWNRCRQRIDWDNMIYIFAEDSFTIPYEVAREFCSLDRKHLLLLNKNMYMNPEMKGMLFCKHDHFHDRESAIENRLDILGWLQGEFEI